MKALIVGFSMIAVSSHRLMSKSSVDLSHQSMLEVGSEGLFDKAIAKMNKEQEDKEEAVGQVIQQKEEQERRQEAAKYHAKHEAEAQVQALSLIKQMQEDAKVDASSMLHQAVTTDAPETPAQEQPEEEHADQGFLGSFNQKLEKQFKKSDQDMTQKEVDNINLHSKIDAVYAPKLAKNAVGDALQNIGNLFAMQHPEIINLAAAKKAPTTTFSLEQKKLMKEHLQSKLEAAKAPKESAKATLDKFDKLSVVPSTIAECDAIGDFLQRAEQQENEARDQAKAEEDIYGNPPPAPAVKAAHHPHGETSIEDKTNVVEQEEDIENPLAQMYASKHPEIMQEAQEREYNMHSYYAD